MLFKDQVDGEILALLFDKRSAVTKIIFGACNPFAGLSAFDNHVAFVFGEDEPGLSESSLYRLIVLPIVEGTFDPQVLSHISNRHENLQAYFALFVQFLTECDSSVVGECASRFAAYRQCYQQKFSVPRFIDSAATMAVEIDLIMAFGKSYGMTDAEMATYREHTLTSVENIMRQNLTSTK